MNISNVLGDLGQLESNHLLSISALEALESAADAINRFQHPAEWAMLQVNLGERLRTLGNHRKDIQMIQRAVAVYRSVIVELKPTHDAMLRGDAYNNLGQALLAVNQLGNSSIPLYEAVDAFQTATEIYLRSDATRNWAMALGNQGVALYRLADSAQDAKMAGKAFAQLTRAEAKMCEFKDQSFAAYFASFIPKAQSVLDRLS